MSFDVLRSEVEHEIVSQSLSSRAMSFDLGTSIQATEDTSQSLSSRAMSFDESRCDDFSENIGVSIPPSRAMSFDLKPNSGLM